MTYQQMIEGLQILAKYELRGLAEHLNGADHDVVCASIADVDFNTPEEPDEDGEPVLRDTRISEADAARLAALGWFISDEHDEAWSHFC